MTSPWWRARGGCWCRWTGSGISPTSPCASTPPLPSFVRPGLGTLNHTALTLEAAERRGLEVPLLICSGTSREPEVVERENLRFFAAMRKARQPHAPMTLLVIEYAHEADTARPERLAVRIEGPFPGWMVPKD